MIELDIYNIWMLWSIKGIGPTKDISSYPQLVKIRIANVFGKFEKYQNNNGRTSYNIKKIIIFVDF